MPSVFLSVPSLGHFEKYWLLQTRAGLQSYRFRSHLSAMETLTERNMQGSFHIISSSLDTNCALLVQCTCVQVTMNSHHAAVMSYSWNHSVLSLPWNYQAHVAQERTLTKGEDKWRLSARLGVSWHPSATFSFERGSSDFHRSVICLKT